MSETLAARREQARIDREARRAAIGYNARSYAQPQPEQATKEKSEPPAHSAVKAEWVDFAVSQGADRDAAESETKAALIETYGQD